MARLYREIDHSHEDIHAKIVQLGKLLSKNFTLEDSSLEEYCLRHPYMLLANLRAYMSVAQNKIYSPLLSSNAPGVRRALKLSYADQKTAWHDGVDVWIPATKKTERKMLMTLTETEASRVIRNGKFTTIVQQQRTDERKANIRANGATPRILADRIIIGHAVITRQMSYDLMTKFWTMPEALDVAGRISAESSKGKKVA